MTIDESGKWWTGTDPDDIRTFLENYAEYPITVFRLSRCSCGSLVFRLDADDHEGVAQRTCLSCGTVHPICDSAEYWDAAEPERWTCVACGSEGANIGVGFSLYEDDGDVRWLYVGCRCSKCGILGCFVDWKVAYTESRHLFDLA